MKKQCKSYDLNHPILDKITLKVLDVPSFDRYPFSIDIIKNMHELYFSTKVTFFVGENGTGKSTLLEAIAVNAGFGVEGGSKNISFQSSSYGNMYSAARSLGDHLTLSWRMKPRDGYFFRAESFFNVATHIDYLEKECGGFAYGPYGGKSLHEQSHGESFLAFFQNRLGREGFFILDEPEAALSPQRQLALLVILHEMRNTQVQFIIATHSPILLAYPGATIYSCDSGIIKSIAYTDTDHYQITKEFLNNPDRYFKQLFF
jgi:predicted ATPase